MGQQQKIHAEAKAENTSGPNYESPHGGGRHHVVMGGRRPPHIMWAASLLLAFALMYFLLLLHIVFSVFGPYCISGPTGAKQPLVFRHVSSYLFRVVFGNGEPCWHRSS